MKRTNPYIAGPPIEEERKFFGRHELIEQLLRDLHDPNQNSFLLYGPRRCGKTSLLKQLEFYLSDEGFIQVYFDLSSKSKLYLNELLYEIARVISDACATQPPRLENFDREGRFFSRVFLPTLEKANQPEPVVLLFDEFDIEIKTKAGQAGREFLPYLLKQFQNLKKTKIICCLGRSTSHLTLKSYFHTFLPISRISKSDMTALVCQSEVDKTLFWDEAAVEKIWEYTHGHPYLTQLLCDRSWSNAQEDDNDTAPKAMAEDVDVALETVLPYIEKLFHWSWGELQAREQAIVMEIVKSGLTTFDSQQVCKLLAKKQIKISADKVDPILKKLAFLDVLAFVESERPQYAIAVPLFAQWIAANYAKSKLSQNMADKAETKQPAQTIPIEKPKIDFEQVTVLEKKDEWGAACKLYEKMLAEFPDNEEIKEKLRHARSQERLADRYNKALNAISTGDLENAKKLLAEVILRDPGYKEAPRFLLLATTGIDANEIKQKLDHDTKELERAKTHISHLQEEISKVKKNGAGTLSSPQQVDNSEKINVEIEKEKRESSHKPAKSVRESNHQHSQKQFAPDRAQETRKQTLADASQRQKENSQPPHHKPGQEKNVTSEIAKLKNVTLGKRPKQASTENSNLRDALLALDFVLEESEDSSNAEPTHRESPAVHSENSTARISEKSIPVGNNIQPAVKIDESSRRPQAKVDRTESAEKTNANVRNSNRDVKLQKTIAKLDKTMDSDKRQHVEKKKGAHDRVDKTQHNRVAKEAQSTPTIEKVAEEKPAALTDTALIEAGQVKKISEPGRKIGDANNKKQIPAEMARFQSKSAPGIQTAESPDTLPAINGQNIRDSDQVNQAESTASHPMGLYANTDFRKTVLVKKSVIKEQKRKKSQASWIAGTLNSLPVFIWAVWLWYMNPLDWGNGGKIFVLIACIPAWLAACRFGDSDKEKHITNFFALTPVASFCFYAILIFESLRPSIPHFLNGNFELLFLAVLIYVMVIIVISVISGQVATIISLGTAGGAFAGITLFLSGGGAIEATFIIILITAIMLVIKNIDISSAASVGVMSGIPVGFLLFVVTFRLSAPTLGASIQAILLSLMAHLFTAGLVYVMIALATKMNAKPEL